jgi:integrase
MRKENSFYHYLNALFAKYHTDFLNQDQLKRNNLMKAAVTEIKQEYKSNLNQLGSALNIFADMLDQFNNQHPEYSVDLPARYFVVRRKPNLRQPIWQKRLREVNKVFHKTCARLSKLEEQLSDNSLLAHLVFFASTCGGLSQPSFLVNLIDQVQRGSLRILSFNNDIHIELVAHSNGATHCKVSTEEVIGEWRRWSPDAYSLSILIQIIDRQASRPRFSVSENKTTTGERAVFSLLLNEVAQQKKINHVSNLKQFCSVAPAVVESFEDSKVPNFYIEYAIGNISSSPLRREAMQCFFDKKIARFNVIAARPHSKESSIAATKSAIYEQGYKEVDQVYREISEALNPKSKNPNRSSSNTVLACLECLKERKLHANAALIVQWLIFKLNTTTGVESLQTYRSTFVRQWLVFTHEVDILAIDVSGISVICDEIIQTGQTEKRKSARAIVLMDFMRFASDFGIAFPSECEHKSYADNFARTNIVTPLQQSLIRTAIRKNNSDTRLAEEYELMLILQVRLGLRINELLKLQLNEIEDSEQCWFTIKYNYFGKNKSHNATRKIPAGLLLIDDEKTMFFSYLKKRRRKASGKENMLLFSKSSVSNEKFSYEDVNTNLSREIKRVCGPYGVLHDLRHTAISTMQLVLAEFDDFIEIFTPYKRDQAAQIRTIMKNGSEQNIYWQLCKFAGHAEPSMTVKTYCHFTDMLLHKYISNHNEVHTSRFWETLTGLPKKTLRRIAPDIIGNDEMLAFLSHRLAKQVGNISLVQSSHQAPQTLQVQVTAEACIDALRAYVKVYRSISLRELKGLNWK